MKSYEKYMPSGVEWIGDIPVGWEVKKLKYVSVVNQKTLTETTRPDYQFRYVDIGSVTLQDGIKEYSEMFFEDAPSRARRVVEKGDTIVSTVRTYLKAIAKIEDDKDVIVSTGFAVVKPLTVNSDFFSFIMRAPYFVENITANSVGVSYPAINAADIMQISIVYPKNSETQQAIAKYLDTETARIDSIIKAKETLIERLKEKRTTLITHVVTKGLSPDAKLKPSGIDWIGDIPDGWTVKKIKYVAQTPLMYGANESPDEFDETQPRYIRITDIDENGNLRDDIAVSLEMEKARPYLLKKNDILFARSGATVGKSYIFDKDIIACFAGYMIRFEPKLSKVIPKFAYYVTFSKMYLNWIESNTIQATIQNVSAEKYNNFYLPLPCIDEQNAIITYLDTETSKINTTISKTLTSIEKLKEYRTALISACVTGKLDVRSV